jgi:hypothetical protein
VINAIDLIGTSLTQKLPLSESVAIAARRKIK